MKITASKENSTHSSKPFFSEKGEGGFWGQTKETERPFFTPAISRQAAAWDGGNAQHTPFFQARSQPVIQPKLTINEPGDRYEQEADAMSDRVMRMSDPVSAGGDENLVQTKPLNITSIQRKCTTCAEEEKVQRQETPTKPLMRKAADGGYTASPQLSSQLNSSKGGGDPLPDKTLASMNQAFGADFSTVRVHTGSQAAEMSEGIQAKAFTHGSDVYFNQGQYSPEASEGKRLLGHELTHVVQQSGGQQIQKAPKKKTYSDCPEVSAPLQSDSEPGEAWMGKQAIFYATFLSRWVVDADMSGYNGVKFVIEYKDDDGFEPMSMESLGPQGKRLDTPSYSCPSIESEHFSPFFEMALMSASHRNPDEVMSWEVIFQRDSNGLMQFKSSNLSKRPISDPSPVISDDDAIPDRQAIYAGIFQKAEEELKDAAIMIASFGLKELAMWIAGGVILKGIGLLGRGALKGFSALRAALKSRNGAAQIGKAVQTLAREEADDLAKLLRKVDKDDALTSAEMRRLEELLGKVDSKIGPAAAPKPAAPVAAPEPAAPAAAPKPTAPAVAPKPAAPAVEGTFTREMHSKSQIIAKGRGIDKVDKLVEKFGGQAKNWTKKKTWDASGNEIHYYEHPGIGRQGQKYAGQNDPF